MKSEDVRFHVLERFEHFMRNAAQEHRRSCIAPCQWSRTKLSPRITSGLAIFGNPRELSELCLEE